MLQNARNCVSFTNWLASFRHCGNSSQRCNASCWPCPKITGISCLSIRVKLFPELSHALMNRLNFNRSSSSAIAASQRRHDESRLFRDPGAAEPGHRCHSVRRAVLDPVGRDRKSTRLNSSHDQISYAVFCLKKKKKKPTSPLLKKKKTKKKKNTRK